jgi:hypothetical protein
MRTYLQAVTGDIRTQVQEYSPSDDPTYPPRPDTLQVAPGTPPNSECFGQLQVTNEGDQDIQITQLGITYTGASRPNPYSYRLIDRCSLYTCGPCSAGCGNAESCLPFADVRLTPGPQGANKDTPVIIRYPNGATPTPDNKDCIYPPLAPGDREDVNVDLTSTIPSQIYNIGMSVTITTSAGSKTITLPQTFDSVFPFAANAQFSCYALQGSAFAVEAQDFSKINTDLCV